jgi:hypothetical protein
LTTQKKSDCTREYRNGEITEKNQKSSLTGMKSTKMAMKTRKEEEEQMKIPVEYKFKKKLF